MALQKRIIRILNKSNFIAHTDPLFKKSGLLKFHDICLLQLEKFMYSYKTFLLPKRFDNMFLLNNQIHTYNNTRNLLAFHLPLCRTNIRLFSIRFQGPKFCKSLSIELVATVSFTSLKKKPKIVSLFKY